MIASTVETQSRHLVVSTQAGLLFARLFGINPQLHWLDRGSRMRRAGFEEALKGFQEFRHLVSKFRFFASGCCLTLDLGINGNIRDLVGWSGKAPQYKGFRYFSRDCGPREFDTRRGKNRAVTENHSISWPLLCAVFEKARSGL
ncbi:hypothetical protein CO666_03820 [Rhizobium chutanense]|uniref:Uncharacterized protein n=2 Tax=Rhizobium chutanense TaxID=2035448 RepID=A0A2A6JHL9_9HYPH|nr:hypothetical protein CO666_03820 [Rhizobium chutanense]